MNKWTIRTNTDERVCDTCGHNYKRVCVLEIEPEHFRCTKCILTSSDKAITQDPLSATFSFTDGTMSFKEYNILLDEAEIELEDLEDLELGDTN